MLTWRTPKDKHFPFRKSREKLQSVSPAPSWGTVPRLTLKVVKNVGSARNMYIFADEMV